jgi:hypothetical protein
MRIVAKQPAPNSEFRDDQAWFERYWPEVLGKFTLGTHARDQTSIQIGGEYRHVHPIPEAALPLLRDGWIQSADVSLENANWFLKALPLPRLRFLEVYALPATRKAVQRLVGCRNLRELELIRSPLKAEQFEMLGALPRLRKLAVRENSVTDTTAAPLFFLPELRTLSVGLAALTDRTLALAPRAKNIQEILGDWETAFLPAEGEGFEPTNALRRLRFSRPVQSTTLPSLRYGYPTTFRPVREEQRYASHRSGRTTGFASAPRSVTAWEGNRLGSLDVTAR